MNTIMKSGSRSRSGKKIIPAILTRDIGQLQRSLEKIRGLTDWVQIDIMDGSFVPNTSISLEEIGQIGIAEEFSLEAHLMVQSPETYFSACKDAKIKRVIFHYEAGNAEKILSEGKRYNFEIGIALNPETPIDAILPYATMIDVALIMSVHPGFGGQEFIPQTVQKIQDLKKNTSQLAIEVDGGITLENCRRVSDAGADYLVVGSSLLESKHVKERFTKLQEIIL